MVSVFFWVSYKFRVLALWSRSVPIKVWGRLRELLPYPPTRLKMMRQESIQAFALVGTPGVIEPQISVILCLPEGGVAIGK